MLPLSGVGVRGDFRRKREWNWFRNRISFIAVISCREVVR